MCVVFYTSGHGLGHASRDVELIHAIAQRAPALRIVMRTSAASWVFERDTPPLEVQRADVDTGMVQVDSLRIDEDESARQAARFFADFDRRIADEVRVLQQLGARLVIG